MSGIFRPRFFAPYYRRPPFIPSAPAAAEQTITAAAIASLGALGAAVAAPGAVALAAPGIGAHERLGLP
ncbi:MAG: hypothetical protein ACREMX_04445, partial [Gemmatimonadales bacterium]